MPKPENSDSQGRDKDKSETRDELIATVIDLESQIDFLAKGILARQSQLNVPTINSKYPFGMSAVEAALEAIDSLLRENNSRNAAIRGAC